jgi:hypothetical protein
MKAHYRKKAEEARAELAKVDAQIKELEDRRANELAGVEEDERRRKEEKAKRRKEPERKE